MSEVKDPHPVIEQKLAPFKTPAPFNVRVLKRGHPVIEQKLAPIVPATESLPKTRVIKAGQPLIEQKLAPMPVPISPGKLIDVARVHGIVEQKLAPIPSVN